MPTALILCERSGAIRNQLALRGFDVTSVDTLPSTTPDAPGARHIVDDALNWLQGDPETGQAGWDLVIARPPCTYLTNAGVRWLFERDSSEELTARARARWNRLTEAVRFFNLMKTANSDLVAIENPVPHKHAREATESHPGIGAPTQIVQPYEFGHPETKKTGWWLRGLPPLRATKDVRAEMATLPKSVTNRVHYASPGADRWMQRSLLVEGMAEAIADQWGGFARLHHANSKEA